MAAIECLGNILHNDIEHRADLQVALEVRRNKKKIYKKIMNDHMIRYNDNQMEVTESPDEETNKIAGYLQLFTTIFCHNFVFRKQLIFELSKLVMLFKLSEETAMKIFKKMLKFLNCNAQSLMDSNNLVHLLSQWFMHAYNLLK